MQLNVFLSSVTQRGELRHRRTVLDTFPPGLDFPFFCIARVVMVRAQHPRDRIGACPRFGGLSRSSVNVRWPERKALLLMGTSRAPHLSCTRTNCPAFALERCSTSTSIDLGLWTRLEKDIFFERARGPPAQLRGALFERDSLLTFFFLR